MNGLDKIIDKILEDAHASANEILNNAKREVEVINAEAEAKKQEISDRIYDNAMREGELIINTARSTLDRNSKAMIMEKKTAMVNEAFLAAKQEILSLEPEKYANLMTQLLCRVLTSQINEEKKSMRLYGEDISPDAYEVIMNKNDRDGQGVYIVAGVRRATVGKINGEVLDKVTLSRETANISGGFILRMGRVEVNASLDAIVDELREIMEAEVMELLFPHNVVIEEKIDAEASDIEEAEETEDIEETETAEDIEETEEVLEDIEETEEVLEEIEEDIEEIEEYEETVNEAFEEESEE